MSPIRPDQRRRYPPDWPEVSRSIRTGRAAGRCECPGPQVCGSRHHPGPGRCAARHGHPHPSSGSVVVLTVAHLDHQPEHSDDVNLLAMCQACHLAHDAAHHSHTRAVTRAGGTLPLDLQLPHPAGAADTTTQDDRQDGHRQPAPFGT